MWVVTILMAFVIVAKVYEIIRKKFETFDAVELFNEMKTKSALSI